MRIHSFNGKMAFWLISFLVSLGVVVALLAYAEALADVAGAVLFVVASITAARLFRGAAESDSARPWWRFTATAGVGYVVGVLTIISGVAYVAQGALGGAPHWAGALAQIIIGALLLHSSFRLKQRPVKARDVN